MTNRIVVSVPPAERRNWTDLKAVQIVFTDEQIVEMVHRYCDMADYRAAYRTRRNAKDKAIRARYESMVAAGDIEEIDFSLVGLGGTRRD